MARPVALFDLAHAQRASEVWGANCGPGAIAAVCGLTLDELRPHLGDFEQKRYTNPTLMWATLGRLKAGRQVRGYRIAHRPSSWPAHGLVRIQWHGPWMATGVPIGARYRRTHWIGSHRDGDRVFIFDINAITVGGWINLDTWRLQLVPWLLSEAVPRADGNWSLTHAVEVQQREEGTSHAA